MSTATVQQIGQDLAAWLTLAQHGETVAIVDGGQEIARLTPPQRTAESAAKIPPAAPDFAARLKAIYGDRVACTEEESAAFWEDMRADASSSAIERDALDKRPATPRR
jgi:antitoxin (DNA-binding transcriptional repressor) of toxin-antitoxin stability system